MDDLNREQCHHGQRKKAPTNHREFQHTMIVTSDIQENRKKTLLSCTIYNESNKPTTAILESASNLSLISTKCAESWGAEYNIKQNDQINVFSASGHIRPCNEVVVSRCRLEVDGEEIDVEMIIYDELSCPILLGLDTLSKMGTVINLRKNRLEWGQGGKHTVSLSDTSYMLHNRIIRRRCIRPSHTCYMLHDRTNVT